MDPFTQRMLARARARREKLDTQLMNAGQETSKQRNPLQDYNQTQLLKVTTEVEVTLTKSGKESIASSVNVTPTKVDSVSALFDEDEENDEVGGTNTKSEYSSAMRDSARSRLRRLGALYADSQISSPIHKTEGNFSAEQDEMDDEQPQQTYSKTTKSGPRLARFAMLADTIKHWEDDLSHPTAASTRDNLTNEGSSDDATEKSSTIEDSRGSKMSKNSLLVHQSPKSKQDASKTKRVVWDENIISTLEAQGFLRTQSKSRLVYDFSKHSSQDDDNGETNNIAVRTSNKVPKLSTVLENDPAQHQSTMNLDSVKDPHSKEMNKIHSNSSSSLSGSSEKRSNLQKSIGSPRVPGVPQMGLRVGSPHKGDASPKTGSVLHRAALFESSSTSPTKKIGKDPAELSVSERLALFERNKGQALIPKAAFSMPVPAKYLSGSNDGDKSQKDGPSKVSVPGKGNRFVDSVVAQLQGPTTTKMNGDKAYKVVPTKINSPGKENGKAKENNVMYMAKPNKVEVTSTPPACNEDLPSKSSKVLAQLFEHGNVITADNCNIKNVQSERQKEMEMLLNRWNKNKQLASSGDSNENNRSAGLSTNTKQEYSGPPRPPPLPTATNLSPKHLNKKIVGLSPPNASHIPSVSVCQSPKKNSTNSKSPHHNPSPERRPKAPKLGPQYEGFTDMKRIKVSPPKPGRLYPCLSDIEATTETESEMQDDHYNESTSSNGTDSSGGENLGDTSFGREILQAAGIRKSPSNSKEAQKESYIDSSDDSYAESAVLDEIDDFLDEALGDDSDSEPSPSPPKRTKDSNHSPQKGCSDQGKKQIYSSPTSSQSHSFKYVKGPSQNEVEPDLTPRRQEHVPTFVVEGNEQVPLMHTVSFYRRQQNMAVKGTPVRQIVRHPEHGQEKVLNNVQAEMNEGSVRNKISELVDEVSKQQTVISQASQALNLCCSTVEFSGSAEEVEGERLLLLATHRRQAALHEIQRLKVEGSLKPGGYNSELTDRGSLVISNITLPLKKDYLRKMAADELCHHFVCLARAQEQVVATPVTAASSENLRRGGGAALIFPGSLRLHSLYSDFKVTLEMYNLQTSREVLPHDIKYHIAGKKDGNGNKLRLTPKKLLKQDSRLVMPSIHSPAGPSAVRSPCFQMSGYVVFSLRELKRIQFTLNKVAYSSPLEGNVQLRLSSELELEVGERGFLTMFEDVSGFGAWHRRWCLLEGATLSYWKYPDDEKKKIPIGQLDLNICTTETVGLVSRDICARPHTFLLETTRPSQPEDEDSLVLIRKGALTTIRHLLSADTRDDRLLWCTQLNKALAMLRAWGSKAPHQ